MRRRPPPPPPPTPRGPPKRSPPPRPIEAQGRARNMRKSANRSPGPLIDKGPLPQPGGKMTDTPKHPAPTPPNHRVNGTPGGISVSSCAGNGRTGSRPGKVRPPPRRPTMKNGGKGGTPGLRPRRERKSPSDRKHGMTGCGPGSHGATGSRPGRPPVRESPGKRPRRRGPPPHPRPPLIDEPPRPPASSRPCRPGEQGQGPLPPTPRGMGGREEGPPPPDHRPSSRHREAVCRPREGENPPRRPLPAYCPKRTPKIWPEAHPFTASYTPRTRATETIQRIICTATGGSLFRSDTMKDLIYRVP